ncbi:MAG: 4-alpha-glucanotransferase [Oscillospiraceae bacterium]
MPLNPPDSAHSPYLSASTFAGSTDLLSPEPFMARGALTLDEVHSVDWGGDPMRVDYGRVHAGKTALWAAAFRARAGCRHARAARRARSGAVAHGLLPVYGHQGGAGRRAVVCLAAAPARP